MAFFTTADGFTPNEIVSLETAKQHLKIEAEFIEEDSLIQGYIDAAIAYIATYLGRDVQNQQYVVKGKSFEDVLSFQNQLKITVDSIVYKDESGAEQTLATENYTLTSIDKFENKLEYITEELPKVQANKFDAVALTVTCGFKKLPKAIKQAVLLLVSDFYEFRSDRPKTPNTTVNNLIAQYRYYANE